MALPDNITIFTAPSYHPAVTSGCLCPLCRFPFQEGQVITKFKDGKTNEFYWSHQECLDKWLEENTDGTDN